MPMLDLLTNANFWYTIEPLSSAMVKILGVESVQGHGRRQRHEMIAL